MTRILTSLIMISHVFNVFVRAKASYERISEVLIDEDEEVIERDKSSDIGEKDLKFANCDIILKMWILRITKIQVKNIKNISFKIEEGQNIGVIGQTGSGKTSLVNLIQNYI